MSDTDQKKSQPVLNVRTETDSSQVELKETVKNEDKFDQVIELEDLLPLKLSRDHKEEEDVTDVGTGHKAADSFTKRTDDIIPAFRDVLSLEMTQEDASIHSAGSVLNMFAAADGENKSEEISLHDRIPEPYGQEALNVASSIKAFFGSASDTVDAAPSFEYDMTHKERGCFIIFNQKKFKSHLGMNERKGTIRDAINLEKTARILGFEHVKTFLDCKAYEIFDIINKISKADHSKYDCFALAILTHGSEGDILYARDDTFHLDCLTKPFMANSCPSLAGKPKLFFIQACRGTQLDPGWKSDTVDARVTDVAYKTEKEVLIIPDAADFLLAFSTVPGYYAWRNQSQGSWFIQALCKCLQEFGDRLELMQIMTRVNRMVAYEFTSYSTSNKLFHEKKQIPSIVTRLTHEVFFRKKGAELRRRSPSPLRPKHRLPATEPRKQSPGCGDARSQTGTTALHHSSKSSLGHQNEEAKMTDV